MRHFSILAVCMAAASMAHAGALMSAARHGVYVVAHRGAHQGIPENTLAAYRRAIELCCDFIEIDVRTTRDGRLASIHNATIDAYVPGQTGKVKEMTLSELQALDIGSRVGPEWKDERIPAVEDIFALCRGRIGIYLDVKDAEPEQLLNLVKQHGMENQCLWYGGPALQRYVQQHCATCHPMPDPGPERMLARVMESFSPKWIATAWDHCSATFVATAHAQGAKVIADDEGPETWEALLELGVDGIQTDEPEALITLLRKRGQSTTGK